jgi:DNA-binding PadR family transcriptional regulator
MADVPPLGELEQLILLAVLRLGADAYGLSIARELQSHAGRRLSRGALYTSLDRLETKGLLRWRMETGGPERQGLPKRVYTVTPRGLAAVRASHRILRRMWRGLDAILKGPAS